LFPQKVFMPKLNLAKLLTVCLLWGIHSLCAQSTVGVFSPQYRPDGHVFKVSAPGKPVKLFFQNDDQYEFLFVDTTFTQGYDVAYNRVDKKNRFVTSFETDSLLSMYFVHQKTGEFAVLSYSFIDSSFTWKFLFQEQNDEHFLKAVTVKDRVCVLSVDSKTDELIVRSYSHSKLVSNDLYKLEFPGFYEHLKADVNNMNQEPFSDIGITLVDSEIEQDLATIYTDRKLYVRDDKLVMTFDKYNDSHLIFIDLSKKKSYYKKFSFKLEQEAPPQSHVGNSFLYKDYFFRLTTNGRQLNLAIVDFRNFRLVRNHNVYDNQPIELKNGPLISEEIVNGAVPRVAVIKNSEKFFKKFRGADLGVTAKQLPNNSYEVMLGSHYTEIRTSPVMGPSVNMGSGFGMGMGMGGGMGTGIGFGSVYDPYYYPYGMGQKSQSVLIEKAYFRTVLSDKEFVHLGDPLQKSYQERKKIFWERAFRSGKTPEISAEYEWKNKIHYSYWDRRTNRFVILEFDK
jgi:hypothetical protein